MSAQRVYRRRLRAVLASADDAALADGVAWYPKAQDIVRAAADAGDVSVERAAIAMAHLSPQCQWSTNVKALFDLVVRDERTPGIMRACFARARAALTADDPWQTFGPRAHKTRNFARNLLGDAQAVTIDTWMLQAFGIDADNDPSWRRVGAYDAMADAVRAVARETEYQPHEVQAIVWRAVRGKAA